MTFILLLVFFEMNMNLIRHLSINLSINSLKFKIYASQSRNRTHLSNKYLRSHLTFHWRFSPENFLYFWMNVCSNSERLVQSLRPLYIRPFRQIQALYTIVYRSQISHIIHLLEYLTTIVYFGRISAVP